MTIIRLAEDQASFFDLDRLDAFATNWPPNVDQYGKRFRERSVDAWVWNNYAIQPDDPVPKLEWFEQQEGLLDRDEVPALTDVMTGEAAGRTDPDDVTGFFTCAVGVDFTEVAGVLHALAEERNLGTVLPLELLSQDHHP